MTGTSEQTAAADKKGGGGGARLRVLWLHTQPEHYFNCMMDDLARGTGYRMAGEQTGAAVEWIAGFSYRGPGVYTENAVPAVAKTVFLTAAKGKEGRPPTFSEAYHKDWRGELMGLGFDVAIVSGYGSRTHREVIAECGRRGIPVAMWSDSNLRSQRGRGLKARLKRWLKKRYLAGVVKNAQLQLTANRLGVAYWRYFGVAREKIVLCPCYSDYRRIDAARARERAEVLGRFGLSVGDRLIMSAARLVPAKGLDVMIRAFLNGGFGAQGYKYVLAGAGPLEGELMALAGDAVGKTVFFVGFQQPGENLALMAHSEVMVLPSRFEPHGIVVGEAMAAGTPVVASDVVGAAADLIVPGVSGRTFRNEDAADLERVLKETLGRAAEMRAGTRRVFEEWYDRTAPVKVVPAVVRGMAATRGVKR